MLLRAAGKLPLVVTFARNGREGSAASRPSLDCTALDERGLGEEWTWECAGNMESNEVSPRPAPGPAVRHAPRLRRRFPGPPASPGWDVWSGGTR